MNYIIEGDIDFWNELNDDSDYKDKIENVYSLILLCQEIILHCLATISLITNPFIMR